MEEPTARFRKLCIGLLALLAVQGAPAVPRNALRDASFRKSGEYFFTADECPFVLEIEDVTPDKVSVYVNDVPPGVSFLLARKETYLPGDSPTARPGTRVILFFRFDKEGVYQIKSVDLRVDGRYERLPLESVYVYENPGLVQPQASVQFSDWALNDGRTAIALAAGEHLRFTLYLRYVVQVVQFSWTIPEDSLFVELQRFAIAEGEPQGAEFSPERVPVAIFDWQPLKSGTYALPAFHIVATSYSGVRTDVSLPDVTVTVSPAPVTPSAPAARDAVPAALAAPFREPPAPDAAQAAPVLLGQGQLSALCALHAAERHSLPVASAAAKARAAAEQEAGVAPSFRVPSVPLWWLLCLCALVLLVAGGVAFAVRRRAAAVLLCTAGVACAALCVLYGVRVGRRYAVFAGGGLRPIPEQGALPAGSVPGGSVVLVEHASDEWYFIRYNETGGWVPRETALVIE